MIRRTILAVLIGIASLCTPLSYTLAQEDTAQLTKIAISVSPANPAPRETVTVHAQSYALDLSGASIRWILDGKVVSDTIGGDSYTFTTKDAGINSTIKVTATPTSGDQVSATVTITPSTMDILWQATDSIVPPLYRGKALPTSESTLKYVAMPELRAANGTQIAPSTLVYTWKQNYNLNQKASGYGKNSFVSANSYLNTSEKINVSAQTRDAATTGTAAVTISFVKPKILWYAASPVYGPQFETALQDSYTVIGSDTSILAEPYFFSPADPASKKLAYVWKLNGAALDTPYIPNTLFLHRDENSTGDAQVSLSLSNVTTLFQEAVAKLTLHLQ